jgi:hypothetical protein
MFLKMKRYPFYLSITSRALKIVIRMSNDRHIGADFFDLFLESGAFRQYAKQQLSSKQNDAVDIGKYLSHGSESSLFPNRKEI